ncbi:hydroxymethylpyrimidine/phosphomethylpyrimidine kinase [Vulgatibacter sp.]|uniref:bifunctional hydroxymethylpyrimidine kinase/phosphomethylpyrimidine kinase n=1 Tax=Vulgatibacter sp. TaxID=1971226 RepID=UPI0035675811
MTPAVLVVAGLDPSGGAGLLADVEAIRAAGARPLACASAITVQTMSAVRSSHPLPVEQVVAQVEALAEEEGPIGAVKLGMLGSAAVARALAALRDHPGLRDAAWVIDPVIRSSSGAALVDGGAAAYGPLLAAATVLTPNLAEVAALAGVVEPEGVEAMEAAGRRLLASGAASVLVKGGHLEGAPVDLLVEPGGSRAFIGVRRPGTKRGTGCRLASHLAGRLAAGVGREEAAAEAKGYVFAYLGATDERLLPGAHPPRMAPR